MAWLPSARQARPCAVLPQPSNACRQAWPSYRRMYDLTQHVRNGDPHTCTCTNLYPCAGWFLHGGPLAVCSSLAHPELVCSTTAAAASVCCGFCQDVSHHTVRAGVTCDVTCQGYCPGEGDYFLSSRGLFFALTGGMPARLPLFSLPARRVGAQRSSRLAFGALFVSVCACVHQSQTCTCMMSARVLLGCF